MLHARAVGLEAGIIVFPQPGSAWASENAGALIATGCPILRLRSVIEVPFAGALVAARERWSARRGIVMPPGGATPIGTFGAVTAAFELAEQIAAGLAPPPRRIVLPIGSTCTTAGLVAGLALAHAVGAWRWPVPIVHGVRVTPWPVTSRVVITQLAARTLARIAALGGPDVPLARARLVVDGGELGAGYGRSTARSQAAMDALAQVPAAPRLDGVYSAKATAALLRLHRQGIGPLILWATKSTVQLDAPRAAALGRAPRALVRWLDLQRDSRPVE